LTLKVKTKTCVKCKRRKRLPAFPRHSKSKDGHSNRCFPCNRKHSQEWFAGLSPKQVAIRNRKALYDISEDEFQALIAKQNGVCAICRQLLPLQVDHCHKTKYVRGLLCGPCNRFIGLAQDDPLRLRMAAQYLEVNS
jgi:hypothetical protein